MKKVAVILFCVLIGLFALTGCSSNQEETTSPEQTTSEETISVKIAEAPRAYYFAPLYIAQAQGFFEEEGLDVEIISTSAGPDATQALVTGEVEFCAIGHGQVANLYLQGMSTKIINEMQNKITFYVMGDSSITDISQLKGKKIGVTKIGAETDGLIRYFLVQAGLDPEKDVTITGVGSMSTMAAALESGEVDVILTWEPLKTQLVKEGKASVIAQFITDEESETYLGSPYYSFSVISATDEYIEANPDIVQKFANAMVKAEQWMQSTPVEEIAEVLQPYFEYEVEDMIEPLKNELSTFSVDGIVEQEAHDTAIKVFYESGLMAEEVAFDDIVDNSFTEKALGK